MRFRGPGSQREWDPQALDRVPRWAAPLLFAVVTAVLFREFIFSDRMLFGVDTLTLGYMARAFFAEALRTTGFPLWNPLILGGTPFLESLAGGDSLYPPSLLLLFLTDTYRALGWKLVLHVFLAGCFMYLWLRMVGASRGASLVAGLIFLLAPYTVTLVYPGHDGKIFVSALTPLLFWACEWSLSRRTLLPLASLGGIVAVIILTTHFQMAYFLFGGVGAYMAFRCLQLGRGPEGWAVAAQRFGLFLGFSVLGAGAAGIQLIPAVDYVTEHSRRAAVTVGAEEGMGVQYSSSWSLHPEEIVSLVVPEFVGNNAGGAEWASDTYWGRNPFKLNHEYLGLVALLLAGLSFLGAPNRGLRWFMVGMGSVVLLFTLGSHTPIWRIFYEIVPGISLFRAPSMAIFLTGFAVATLAGLGVDHGRRVAGRGEVGRALGLMGSASGILALGGIVVAVGGLEGLWTLVFSPELTDAKAQALQGALPFITRGFFLAALLAGLTAALWWALSRGILNPFAALALLVLLVCVDQIRVNDAFIQTLDYAGFSAPDPNHRFLMERAEEDPPFRVFSMMQGGQDVAPGMHGLELAAGHHPNDLGRYRELIGMEGGGIPEHLATFNPNVLDILNIRFILWPDAQYGRLEGVTAVSQIELPDGRVFSSVYPYPAQPRARVVGEAIVVPEENTLDVVLDPAAYDPSSQVVLNEAPTLELGGPEVQGTVSWVERTPNRLVMDVEASGPAILVLSENWFPAWVASVGGEEAPVLRADHTLRAVAIPAGTHRVEFRYRSSLLRASLGVSLFCLLLLIGSGTRDWLHARRRQSPTASPEGPRAEIRR